MLRRAAVTCLVVLATTYSSAFVLDVHTDVTEKALNGFVKAASSLQQKERVPASWTVTLQTGFSPQAIREIVRANRATDAGDCGDRNPDVPASPCNPQDASAVTRLILGTAPAVDHFDDEKIQEASNQIFNSIETIRRYLLARRFVAARKVLGGTLHGLQDFYAHTNWVDLNNQVPERRLGSKPNAFSEGAPRIALKDEPVCVDGDRLLTTLDPKERQEFFLRFARAQTTSNPGRDPAVEQENEARMKEAELRLLRSLSDRPLTSGYFSFPDATSGPQVIKGSGPEPEQFAVSFKCRHGYVSRLDQRGLQTGIAKDEQKYTQDVAHNNARLLAEQHSVNFLVNLFNDERLRPDRATYIMGLMGYESRVTGFNISQVPGPPPTQTMWDGPLEVFLNIWAVHPDIEACFVSSNGRICSEICKDADSENPTRQCQRPIGPQGMWLSANDANIGIEVWDIDPVSRQLMARGSIPLSDPCLSTYPMAHRPSCEIKTPTGSLVIQFDIPGTCYQDMADPSNPCWSGRLTPPAAGNAGAGSGAPPAAPNPGGRSLPAALPRTPEEAGALLGLRDADNCVGNDTFVPAGTAFASSPLGQQLGPDQANRVYQTAAFAMSISNPAAKQTVLNTMQSRVGDDTFFGVMTQVIGDPRQSRPIVAAYQDAAKYVAGKVVSTGLAQLLQPARPSSALATDVDRWILKKLATPPLVSRAVDMMLSGPRTISAECALNQLAKEGFTDTVNGR